MKNFFKKLSFVLALAMVLTSLAPAAKASAATTGYIYKKGYAQATWVYVFIGGKTCNLDYNIGGKTSGVKGTWKSSDESVATVNSAGVVSPLANGKTKITFTSSDKKTYLKQWVYVGTRASKLNAYDAAGTKINDGTLEVVTGEATTVKVTMPISSKIQAAGGVKSSYASYAEYDSAALDVVKNTDRSYTITAKEAGEHAVTIVANQTTQANVRKNKYYREVKFTVKAGDTAAFGITDLKATKVTELQATFGAAVDTTDVSLSVAKDGVSQQSTVAWNDDKTVATITLVSKIKAGTYVVTATSASTKEESSKEVVTEDEKVATIEILNDVALTGRGTLNNIGAEAYVYYQVLNQYGDDLTSSTSVQWSASCSSLDERSLGRLKLTRTDEKAFTYGEQVYVTGVYAKSGLSVQKTLTIGAEQAVNTVEMAGFVRRTDSKLLSTLPSGFKSNEYYLVFTVADQNGNKMKPDKNYSQSSSVTFISDNVLLVSDFGYYSTTSSNDMDPQQTINGIQYNTVIINPGSQVAKGGEVNITAIASMTGNKVTKNFVIGANHILTSFTMSAPTTIIADGEEIEIPFTALDQDGDSITNFVTLADNLNTLSFSAPSDGELKLMQKADGTAKLVYKDGAKSWNENSATDGVDRKVSLTAMVLGSGTDTLMLDILDKARPETISDVDIASAFVKGSTLTIDKISSFTFLDQYGRVMKNPAGTNWDNGFIEYASENYLKGGSDFNDYKFYITAEVSGNKSLNTSTASAIMTYCYDSSKDTYKVDQTIKFTFGSNDQNTNNLAGNQLKFSIVKQKNDESLVSVSSVDKSFTLVDISNVNNFEVTGLKTQYLETPYSRALTGVNFAEYIINSSPASIVSAPSQTFEVKGTYNGITVTIPESYITIESSESSLFNKVYGKKSLEVVTGSNIVKWSDLYDVTTSNYLRKNANFQVKFIIGNQGSVIKEIAVSDAMPHLAELYALETVIVSSNNTEINVSSIFNDKIKPDLSSNSKEDFVYDQYNNAVTNAEITFSISDIKEADGYVKGNFKVTDNNKGPSGTYTSKTKIDKADAPKIEGAEVGDTFILTITAKAKADDGNIYSVSKAIKVTVGADELAVISSSDGNLYTKTNSLKDTLDNNRKTILGITTNP